MMFSRTSLWVAVAAVATASSVWLVSDFSGRCCKDASPVSGAVAMPATAKVVTGNTERIHYDSQTNTHYFHDIPDGLYYTYSGDGFSFRPDAQKNSEGRQPWQVDLSLQGVRRGDARLEAAENPVVSVAPTEMFIDAGAYAVEYTRSEEGVRQNFFIREQLPGDGPLTVELECRSELEMSLAGEDDLLFFEKGTSNPVACYRDLHVWDAAGRVLEAHMELADNSVRLVVDDTDALYPVTVDPLVSSFWNSLGLQSNEKQGWTVAAGRDINNDGYEDILVGSPYYDRNGSSDVGCVTVYLGTAGGVMTTASCTIYGTQAGACFGWSVAFAGDVNNDGYEDVVIGAPFYDYSGIANAGRVYVYHGTASGLPTTANWTYEYNQAGAEFGRSVAGAGRTNNDSYDDIIVGAPGYSNGESHEGAAHIFEGSTNGLSSMFSWSAEGNQTDAAFGTCVASAGDVNDDGYDDLLVGAPYYTNGQTEEGRAFMYYGWSNGPGQSASWTAESNQASSEFGMSLASAGDVNNDGYADVVVGAPRYDHGQTNEGKIYLYLGSGNGLGSSEVWTAESNQNNAYMGMAVASAGDVDNDGYDDIMTGIPYYDDGLRADAGRVAIYGGNSLGTPGSMCTIEGENAGELLGYTLACAGKINDNNRSDIIVGSPAFSSLLNDCGKASIFRDPDLIYSKGGVLRAPEFRSGASVYPNPSRTGVATVEFDVPEQSGVTVEVLDYTGAVVYKKNLGAMAAGRRSAVLPLSSASDGVYIVRVAVGSMQYATMVRIAK